MEIILTIINIVFSGVTWFFLGRSSIYNRLLRDFKEALTIIDKQQALIDKQQALIRAYEIKYNTEKDR